MIETVMYLLLVYASGHYEIGRTTPAKCEQVVSAYREGREVVAENPENGRQELITFALCVDEAHFDKATGRKGV